MVRNKMYSESVIINVKCMTVLSHAASIVFVTDRYTANLSVDTQGLTLFFLSMQTSARVTFRACRKQSAPKGTFVALTCTDPPQCVRTVQRIRHRYCQVARLSSALPSNPGGRDHFAGCDEILAINVLSRCADADRSWKSLEDSPLEL
jgi:hypothetical protein